MKINFSFIVKKNSKSYSILMFFIFISITSPIIGQPTLPDSDSTKEILLKRDSSSVLMYVELAKYFEAFRPDSAIYYAYKGLDLSIEIEYKVGEIKSLNRIGSVYLAIGEYAQAINFFTEVSEKSNIINYERGSLAAESNIGLVYLLISDYESAIQYFHRVLEKFKRNADNDNILIILTQLTLAYIDSNQDSAFYYGHKTYQMSLNSNNRRMLASSCMYLGQIYEQMNKLDLSLAFYKDGLGYVKETNMQIHLPSAYYLIANVYSKLDIKDSILQYAQLAIKGAEQYSNKKILRYSSKLLADFYMQTNKDSSLNYFTIHAIAMDSIVEEMGQKELRIALTNEQLRQIEIKRLMKLREDRSRYNLKLIGITVFIIFFVILIVAFRKNKVQKKLIIFLGSLALLMIFELNSMLIHSFLEKLTHHNPILILLFLIIVASILVPLHKRFEDFITKRLTQSNLTRERTNKSK